MITLLLLYVIGSVLLMVLAVPMIRGKIPPNGLYGFRVPATIEHPELWYPVNRYAGKCLFWTGAISTFGAIILYFVPGLSVDGYALACLGVFVLAFGITIILCFRYLSKLRHSPSIGE